MNQPDYIYRFNHTYGVKYFITFGSQKAIEITFTNNLHDVRCTEITKYSSSRLIELMGIYGQYYAKLDPELPPHWSTYKHLLVFIQNGEYSKPHTPDMNSLPYPIDHKYTKHHTHIRGIIRNYRERMRGYMQTRLYQ